MRIAPCREKWPGTLTDRERFARQIRRQPVDRCVNMEFGFWKENFSQWSIFRENGVTNNIEADVFFNFDRVRGVGGGVGLCPPFPEETVRETATTKIIRNSQGLLAEVPKDDHETIPHYLESSIKTPEDWEAVKRERLNPDHPDRTVDLEALKAEHPADRDYPLVVHCGSMIGRVRDMLTVEGLAYACADDPGMVEDMVETRCVLVERFLDQVLGVLDFDAASGWEDISCNSGPLVSVGFFNDVVVPRYARIRAKLEAHGIEHWYTDCDGDIRPLLEGFLEGGINGMFPFEVNGCGHPGALLDAYGDRIFIMGGVDKMKLRAGREAIRTYLESLVPYVEAGGVIPPCDHPCPPDVKEEDYLYYLDLKQEMFGQVRAVE